MGDNRPKPAIPAWQRAPLSKAPTPSEDPVYSQPENAPNPSEDPVYSQSEDAQSQPADEAVEPAPTSSDEEPESIPANDTSPTTAPPAEATSQTPVAFESSDFNSFKQQQQSQLQSPTRLQPKSTPQSQPQPQQQQQAAPPIITYPEFLVDAHKPPPLITPARIVNAVYIAGSTATLLYAASKWIINPMRESLSEARHDFLNHSQSKVDQFNDRLSEIVSKVPETKNRTGSETDAAETESITSDPTELYHRDMGTQTSSEILPLPSATEVKKDAVSYHTDALETMRTHINELAEGSERTAESNQERQDSMNKLRHYLDGMIYGGPMINAWQSNEDAITTKGGNNEDPIEELKKEIRGVKGVLLSAKRFPAVGRPVSAT